MPIQHVIWTVGDEPQFLTVNHPAYGAAWHRTFNLSKRGSDLIPFLCQAGIQFLEQSRRKRDRSGSFRGFVITKGINRHRSLRFGIRARSIKPINVLIDMLAPYA